MARIVPFCGLRYNKHQVGDLSQVVSPPYDVISPAEETSLRARSAYNAVHIDLPRISDPEANLQQYAQAGRLFRAWIESGVLEPEKEPAFYAYRQTYMVPGTREKRQLLGFIGALQLVELSAGVVLPHEHTFAKPKADRLNLMRATAANLSPVYSFYSDPAMRVETALESVLVHAPQAAAVDDNGDLHEVWVVKGKPITVAQEVLSANPVFIADGHHRYETALDYQRERALTGADPRAAWNTVMMMLVNLDADGLTILPTHRVVHGIPPIDLAVFGARLREHFTVNEAMVADTTLTEQVAALQPGTIAVYLGAKRLWLLERRNPESLLQAIPENRSRAWKQLDVAILHHLILEQVVGLSRGSIDRQENIRYTRDSMEACRAVDQGEAEVAFLLPSPEVADVKNVALAGDCMPHKSTYFYPKLLTGLLYADLNANLPL